MIWLWIYLGGMVLTLLGITAIEAQRRRQSLEALKAAGEMSVGQVQEVLRRHSLSNWFILSSDDPYDVRSGSGFFALAAWPFLWLLFLWFRSIALRQWRQTTTAKRIVQQFESAKGQVNTASLSRMGAEEANDRSISVTGEAL